MRVIITGGAGFIGLRLAKALLARGFLVDSTGTRRNIGELVLFDIVAPLHPLDDPRVRVVTGDGTDPEALASALGPEPDTVFHLAGVVSGAAEADLALGLRVNLDGTRLLLDQLAATGRRPKLIFASSLAVYGGGDAIVDDSTAAWPMGSYGTQKLASELLVGDYDRRGLVDGRALRFPTIAVRPGKPNLANSSFISSIIREPAAGLPANCPVPLDLPLALMSPSRLVEAILIAHDAPSADYGWPRTLVIPAVQVTALQMLDCLEDLAGPRARALVTFEPNPAIAKMVGSWPAEVRSARATALGIAPNTGAGELVAEYLSENPPKPAE